jgi:hypothetical protein
VWGWADRRYLHCTTLLFINYCPWKRCPPLCHLDRSVPGFPTSRCWRRPRVRLSVKRAACRPSKPRLFTGNPGERSGEISVWMLFPGNVFRQGGKSRATPRLYLVPAAGRRSRGLSPSGSRNGRRRLRVRHSCWSPAAASYRRSSGSAVWQRTLPVPST